MNISVQVKLSILETCGGPTSVPEKLAENVPLAYLGFDENPALCRELEGKLQQMALQHQTGNHTFNGLISEHTTVSECIDLVV